MKACAAGGSSLPPTAPKERNRSATAPFNQYGARGLGGAPELAVFGERLQLAGDHGHKKQSLSAIEHDLGYCTQALHFCSCATCDVSACLRSRVCCFFRKSTRSDGLSLQHVGRAGRTCTCTTCTCTCDNMTNMYDNMTNNMYMQHDVTCTCVTT